MNMNRVQRVVESETPVKDGVKALLKEESNEFEKPLTLGQLRNEMRYSQSADDEWGNAMSWLYAVCVEMGIRDIPVPASWEYSPSIGGGGHEEGDYAGLVVGGTTVDGKPAVSTPTLKQFGTYLDNLVNKLDQEGKSY